MRSCGHPAHGTDGIPELRVLAGLSGHAGGEEHRPLQVMGKADFEGLPQQLR